MPLWTRILLTSCLSFPWWYTRPPQSAPCSRPFTALCARVPQLMCLFQEEDDYDVMQDPEFLQSVLENLPGVDPNNEAIRNAMGSLASQATKDGKKDKKEEDKK